MSHNPLIDSLTSHISLYNSLSVSSNLNSSSNSRSVILKWFSSLNVHQRQSNLTCVDFKFVQVVIHMLGKLRTRGHGFFIVLPDLPSEDPPHLPSTCFKRSSGLLTRIAQSSERERTIFESARLFSSTEGEKLEECSCSVNNVDSLTMSEDFFADVDRFVEVMDGVSNGKFLRGEDSELGSDWVELNWLKEKGYYSMEAFIANRLEVALRLAWVNSNNFKKKGMKLKEKATTAGIAANVFWRKKGCLEWWTKLDISLRRKILNAVLGKSAKSLTRDILRWESGASADEIWLFNTEMERPLRYLHGISTSSTHPKLLDDSNMGLNAVSAFCSRKPTSISDERKKLYVLQCIVRMLHQEYDKDNLFFSTFGSVHTISDCIFRKLRGLLMVISLNCTKFELLGEVSNKTSKSKNKSSSSGHRKKGKTRGMKSQTSAPRSHEDDCPVDLSNKDLDSAALAQKRKEDLIGPLEIPSVLEMSLEIFKMEHEGGISEKVHAALPKNRKRKHKNKNGGLNKLTESGISVSAAVKSSSSLSNSQDPCTKVEDTHDKSSFSAMENDKVIDDIIVLNPSPPSSFCESAGENDVIQSIEDKLIGSSESFCQMSSQFSNMIENQYSSAGSETLKSLLKCTKSPPLAVLEIDNSVSSEDVSIKSSVYVREPVVSSSFMDKPPRTFDLKRESLLTQRRNTRDIGNLNSWKCSPFEWPSVAPLYFPSFNSPLPPATDRLHLDVGRNWHNHFRQSFVPTLHQARTSSLEGGCSPILTRPLLMSFDWPPVVRSACRLASSISCNYDSAFISRRQSTFQQGFTASSVHLNTSMMDEEKHSADPTDFNDSLNRQDVIDEYDSCWISEEELEVHAVSGMDYNQCFGGGVMYWNSSDHPGTGFSRPPSLSSDDSAWAWREADITRAVDDMVAFSSSYSTNGLTSPTAASFCSPFDPLGSGHQGLGYVMPGNEVPIPVLHSPTTVTETLVEEEASTSLINLPSDVEGNAGDSYQYPILRPIIVPNMSRERLASELKCNHDNKSPHVPPSRRERPRLRRPPSPVVLCVPRAPRPPPPSPVGDSRKHRGFPTVRSGSSSPRHWGMKGWLHDGTNTEEGFIRMDGAEVVWPSWRYNNLSTRPMIQPLSPALLKDRLIAMSQLAREQEHPDVAIPLQPPELQNCHTRKESFTMFQSLLHDEIESFCLHVAAENMAKKPYITWAVKRVTRSIQVLWPRSRTNIFGSNATNLCLPTSDVDLVVCLPPVRNLEPIKEAGILEGRNGIKETLLQHAARCLANQEWVKNDSLKIVENTAIPIIMLVVEVPHEVITSSASNVQSPKEELSGANTEQVENTHSEMVGLEESAVQKCTQINFDSTKDSKSVRLDISFKTPSHTGLQTTELVKQLTEQFPAATPLALVLKQFLADRSLDQSYSGGLSSYCLVLLIIRFLQHEHHLSRPINQNFGRLLMDFLYFFGNVYDPRQMRVSIQGSGVYVKRERGCSIDPIHVDDPLFPMNNVGRNCFRIHQCIKAFADAYSILEAELASLPNDGDERANIIDIYNDLLEPDKSFGLVGDALNSFVEFQSKIQRYCNKELYRRIFSYPLLTSEEEKLWILQHEIMNTEM